MTKPAPQKTAGSSVITWCMLLAIIALGAALRIGAVSGSNVTEPIRGDAGDYFFYGINLLEAGIYSRAEPEVFGAVKPAADALRAPGYSLFVAATLSNSWKELTTDGINRSIKPVIYSQTALGILTIFLAFLAGRFVAGPACGLFVALLTALSPHLVNINIYLLSESLFSFFFLLSLLALLHLSREQRTLPVSAYVLAGVILACASLVRPTVQYLPYFVAATSIILSPQQWRAWAAFVGSFFVIMLLWALRNLAATGAMSDPTLMVAAVQVGGYPDMMFNHDPQTLGMPYRFDPVLTNFDSMSNALSVIWQKVQQQPGEYLHWYLIGKPLALFNWDIIPIGTVDGRLLMGGDIYIYPTPGTPYSHNPLFILSYLLSRLVYFPLLVLAGLSAVLVWLPQTARLWGSAHKPMRLLSLCLLYVVGIHMVGSPFPRYAIPFQPLLYLLGTGFVVCLWRRWTGRQAKTVEGTQPVL